MKLFKSNAVLESISHWSKSFSDYHKPIQIIHFSLCKFYKFLSFSRNCSMPSKLSKEIILKFSHCPLTSTAPVAINSHFGYWYIDTLSFVTQTKKHFSSVLSSLKLALFCTIFFLSSYWFSIYFSFFSADSSWRYSLYFLPT